jgi:hypothetical protein
MRYTVVTTLLKMGLAPDGGLAATIARQAIDLSVAS